MMILAEFVLRCIALLTLLVTLVFVVGIVWRVEAELDRAYKWFSFAVVFFLLAEIFEVLPSMYVFAWNGILFALLRVLAVVSLFWGMYYMRDLVRRMDGEKPDGQK